MLVYNSMSESLSYKGEHDSCLKLDCILMETLFH